MVQKDVVTLFLSYLRDRVRHAKGTLITFRPSQVANMLIRDGIIHDTDGRATRSISKKIRDICEVLREVNLLMVVKRCARGKVYGLTRDSLLFHILHTCNDVEFICIVEKVREFIDDPKEFEEGKRDLAYELVRCIGSELEQKLISF